MMLPRHNYRSPEMRAAEERLVYETLGNAETQQKAHIETVLQSSAPTQDQLDQLARLIQTEHPQVAIQGAKETFRKLEGKAKSQVTENISKLEARSRVIAASDEEQSALQASIDALKGEDVLTISPQSESPTVETDTPHTFVDKAKDVAKTVGKSLGDAGEQMTNAVLPASITKEMSRNKKIAIAGVATVGVGLVLWSLFKRARRAAGEGADAAQQTEGGFFRKWLVRIGVTAGVLFGVKMLADRYLPSGTTKDILDGAGAIGGGAFIGGKKGMETVAENFRRSFEFKNRTDFQTDTEYHQYLASIVEDHGDEVIDRKNFASNEEYTKAMEGMLDVYQQNGGNWVLTGNTLMFIGRNGYDTVNHVGKLDDIGINLWGAITEKSFEKGQDAAMLYGEGVVLYASSFALLDGAYLSLVLGPKGAAIQAVKNSLGWPFSIYGKGKSIVGIFIPSEAKAIRSIEKAAANASWGYNLKRIKEWGKGIKEWNSGLTMTEEYAESLFEEYQQWRKFDKQFESYKQYKSALGHRQAVLQKKLEEVCKNLIREQKIIPNFLKNPNAADLVEQIKRGQVTIGNFEATMDKLYTNFETTSANAASSSVNTATNTADEIAETGTDASKAAKATTPEAASQTHHTGQKTSSIDNTANLQKAEIVADSVSDSSQARQLETMIETIAESDPEGAKALQTLLDSASPESRIQILNTPTTKVPKLGAFAKTCVALGIVGDVFSVWTGYLEHLETQESIKNTSNTELQNMYKKRYMYIGSNVTIGTVGLGTGIASLCGVQASTTGPISLATIPLTLAVGGLYSEHEWETSKAMDPNDIARKYAPEDIIAMLSYTPFWEKVGKTVADTNMDAQEAIDQKHINLMRITALARSTTTVSMPTKIYDHQTYTERPLNADEQQLYGGALQTYVNAKISYLEKHAAGITNERYISEPFANTDMGKLLMESDQYARLTHDRFVLSQQTENPESKKALKLLPLATLSEEDQIREYQHTKLKNSISSLMLFSGNTIESSEGVYVQSQCEQQFIETIQPYMLAMQANIKREDTNFKTLWSDGNAGDLVLQHVQMMIETRIKQQSSELTAKILAWEKLQPNPVSDTQNGNEAMKEFVAELLVKELEKNIQELQQTLSRPVTDWWTEMKPEAKQNAEQKMEATKKAERLAQTVNETKVKNTPPTHGDFHKPEAIEGRMKAAALEMQLYQEQRKVNTGISAPNIAVERMARGSSAIKNIMKNNAVYWDTEHTNYWAISGCLKDSYKQIRIFFNPDTAQWEWDKDDKPLLVRKNPSDTNDNRLGNSPSDPLPLEKMLKGNPLENLIAVMRNLSDINKLSQ